jgi:hypothetical protein
MKRYIVIWKSYAAGFSKDKFAVDLQVESACRRWLPWIVIDRVFSWSTIKPQK